MGLRGRARATTARRTLAVALEEEMAREVRDGDRRVGRLLEMEADPIRRQRPRAPAARPWPRTARRSPIARIGSGVGEPQGAERGLDRTARSQVRAEVGADHVDHVGRACHHRARSRCEGAPAVRGDEVAGVDRVLLVGAAVPDGDGDPVRRLLPGLNLVMETDRPGRPGLGLALEQRLEPQLKQSSSQSAAVDRFLDVGTVSEPRLARQCVRRVPRQGRSPTTSIASGAPCRRQRRTGQPPPDQHAER